jgi:endonuclease/exonuclease/phosphatase family metal-dependent hydrolase
MKIATWNLNNRVGKVRFRPEAADAAVALGADVLVLTEFFPQEHENRFRNTLRNAGLSEQVMSPQPAEVANRVLIASRLPLFPLTIESPTFDQQFRANVAAVSVPSIGLSIVGVRVPAYGAKQSAFLIQAWDWLESTAATLRHSAAVMLGDLNLSAASPDSRGGGHFRRILASGWQRAAPADGATYFGHGGRTSEIDHIVATDRCVLSESACVKSAEGYAYCDVRNALSDHAALQCQVELR